MMRRGLIAIVVLVFAAALSLQSRAVQAVLLGWYLPEFPHPERVLERLADGVSGEVHFPSASPFDLEVVLDGMRGAIPTTGLGHLTLPPGATRERPVPALVILPGSGGIAPGRERDYAELLARHGIASLVVEYYLPRGMTEEYPYRVRTSTVTEFDVVSDAYAALRLLASSALIDPRRIGVIGFSYGGMAVRWTMDRRLQRILAPHTAGFALYADFYGPCFQVPGSTEIVAAPLLTVRGDEDASNDLAACAAREHELRLLGASVEAHLIPGAGHAWEVARPRAEGNYPYLAGCELRYDERGRAWLDGERVAAVESDASRMERIAARITSGGAYRDCLHYGYIVGRDDVARQRGYELLLDFLARHFGAPDVSPRQDAEADPVRGPDAAEAAKG